MSDFKVRVKAELDTNSFSKQLKKVGRDSTVILKRFKLDTSTLPSEIQASLDKHKFKINLDGIKSTNIESQAKKVGATVEKVFKGAFSVAQSRIAQGSFNLDISKINKTFEQLKSSGHRNLSIVESDIQRLRQLISDIQQKTQSNADPVDLLRSMSEFDNTVIRVKNNLGVISNETKTFVSSLKLEKLDNDISKWFEKNSKAAHAFGSEASSLHGRLSELKASGKATTSEFQILKNEFEELKQRAISTGQVGATVGEQLGKMFKNIFQGIASLTIIQSPVEILRRMYQNVYAIDTNMNELKKVTNETSSAYSNFLKGAGSDAKELGTTISDLVGSTSDFARLGYTLDQSKELAKVANIYAVVGDEVDGIDGATKSIISTMTAFGDEVGAMDIVDKFNEVGNNFAISSGGIGESLLHSASSLAAANNTLDQTIALITAANTVVQDPSSVGTAFRTISMRIRGAKTELEEAGLETDGMVESTAKLREEMLALSGVDIMLDEDTFKSTYDIMDELSAKWEGFTDIQRASIIELVAGKNQGNVMSSLMSNFDIARKAYETSMNSSGSALKEHEKTLDSLEAKLKQFSAAWEQISQLFLDSSLLKGAVDTGTSILSIFAEITNTLGPLPTLITAVTAALSFKNVGVFKTLEDEAGKTSTNIGDVFRNLIDTTQSLFNRNKSKLSSFSFSDTINDENISKNTKAFREYVNAVNDGMTAANAQDIFLRETSSAIREKVQSLDFDSLGELDIETVMKQFDISNQAQIKSFSTYKTIIDEFSTGLQNCGLTQEQYIEAVSKGNSKLADYLKNNDAASVSVSGYARSIGSATAKTIGMQVATAALNMALSALTTFAIQQIITGFSNLVHMKENASAAADELASKSKEEFQTFKDESKQLDELIAKYQELASSDTQDSTTRAKIKDIQGEIVSLIGDQALSLDLVNSKLDEELDKLSDIRKEQAETTLESSMQAYHSARDSGDKAVGGDSTFFGLFGGYAFVSPDSTQADENRDINKILRDNGYRNNVSVDGYGTIYIMDDLDQDGKKLEDAAAKAEYLQGIIETIEQNYSNYAATDVYNGLVSQRNAYLEYVNSIDSSAKQLLDQLISYSVEYDNELSYFTVDSMESFNEYRDKLIEIVKNNPNLAEALSLGDISDDDIEQQVSAYLGTLSDFSKYYNQWAIETGNITFSLNIESEISGIEKLTSAMNESASATGLTKESIEALTSRYQNLEGHEDALANLFERTASGIHLNRSAVEELEAAYAEQNKANLENTLQSLKEKYSELTADIYGCSNAQERLALTKERERVLQEIDDTANLIYQYKALTSSYNAWQAAQSATDQRDMYSNLISGYDDVKKLLDQGWFNDSEVNTYLDAILGEDRSGDNLADFEKISKNIQGTSLSIADFFRLDKDNNVVSDGLFNFLDVVKKKLGDDFVQIAKDGSYSWDFTGEKILQVADALGISVEMVEIFEKALNDVTDNVNLNSFVSDLDISAENMSRSMNEVVDSLKASLRGFTNLWRLDLDSFNFDSFDVSDLERQIENIGNIISDNFMTDGVLDLSINGAEDAALILATLLARKQELEHPIVMDVDTSKIEDPTVRGAIENLQGLQNQLYDHDYAIRIGADTSESLTQIQGIVQNLLTLPEEKRIALGLDSDEAKRAIEELQNASVIDGKLQISQDSLDILEKIVGNIDGETLVAFGVDGSLIKDYQDENHEAKGTVHWDNNITKVTQWISMPHTAEGTVVWSNKTSGVSSVSGVAKSLAGVFQSSKGTTKAQGTAYAHGSWGAKDSGLTLGGEVGPELVVRNGRFFTIGQNSAEFFYRKKGDIVFNAEQTRQILSNGKITNGKKRGVAYADGTPFPTSGIAFGYGSEASGRRLRGNSISVNGRGSGKSSSSSSKDDEPKVFDWIEVAIARIERVVDRLKTTAENTYKALKTRLGATYDEITKVNEELVLQQRAYDRYMQQANSVGLSSDLAARVQSGAIDINEYDADTQELISDYQTWYEKALDCSDAIQELHNNLASLYEDNFNNIQDDFDNQLKLLDHLTKTYKTGIDALEEKGYLESTKYYSALQDVEKQNINTLQKEFSALYRSFSEAMASGEIEEYSDAWYSMQTEINGVKEAIAEANVQLLEYSNAMREIEWGYFDYIQNRIGQITSEADFLIDLLSNSNLYQDNGQFSDEGTAAMGLHAQNYNVYMAQADQYANEILALNEALSNDPYNTDLINRREELLELQQKSILAAEDEKQAIVDLVEDGINIELDALKELIDTYTDSLDSAKDLYEYQKKISEKTADIASLQKQLSAYENDTSEETRAKIQQIKVDLSDAQADLAETEYDQFVSDTKKLLDNLYDEYKNILNERLDNVDALLTDMIGVVNANSSSINETLLKASNDVGYTISQGMQSIWSNDGAASSIVAKYGDGFTEKLTTINQVLSSIQTYVASMVKSSDATASSTVSNTSSTTKPDKNVSVPKANITSTPSPAPSAPAEKPITVGGKINAGSAKIYDYAGDSSGERQYYRNDPIYTVLKEQNGYVQVRHHSLSKGISGWFKKSDIKAYSQGGIVDYTGLAMVHGRPDKPESMLNAQDTQHIIELKGVLDEMSRRPLGISGIQYPASSYELSRLSDITGVLSNVTASHENSGTNIGAINIEIPIDHVLDYEDFITKVQHDNNFEKMIKAMTIDQLAGGSSLAKNKYKWNR